MATLNIHIAHSSSLPSGLQHGQGFNGNKRASVSVEMLHLLFSYSCLRALTLENLPSKVYLLPVASVPLPVKDPEQ